MKSHNRTFINDLIDDQEFVDLDIEPLAKLCDWLPASPNLEKWPINTHKKGYYRLFYKPLKKQISRRILNFLLNPVKFKSMSFPIVRKKFNMYNLQKDLFSIQPLSLPVGLTFYMDYVFNEDKNMSDHTEDKSLQSTGSCDKTANH